VSDPLRPRYPLFERNFVLQASSRYHYWQGSGPLSIKTFAGGRALYRVDKRCFAVEERSWLLLNEGQPYTVSIESDTDVDSFCVFFRAGFAEEVCRDLTKPAEHLLDLPFDRPGGRLEFQEMTFPDDNLVTPLVGRLRAAMREEPGDPLLFEEHCHGLVHALLRVQRKAGRDRDGLPAKRPSTRQELFRRLTIAREYIHAHYRESISLEDIARAAGLSPNHLLRGYRSLYGRTPYQHLSDNRLEEARRLLDRTGRSVTEIGLEIGFAEASSFNKMFKRLTGMSPQQYRNR